MWSYKNMDKFHFPINLQYKYQSQYGALRFQVYTDKNIVG